MDVAGSPTLCGGGRGLMRGGGDTKRACLVRMAFPPFSWGLGNQLSHGGHDYAKRLSGGGANFTHHLENRCVVACERTPSDKSVGLWESEGNTSIIIHKCKNKTNNGGSRIVGRPRTCTRDRQPGGIARADLGFFFAFLKECSAPSSLTRTSALSGVM
jgi:hypothetical protein